MNYYVTLTTNCNLKCKYCYGKSCDDFGSDFHGINIDYSIPPRLNYPASFLQHFLEKGHRPVLIFYGGEPLLEIEAMKSVMDAVASASFVIQTNGLQLNKVGSEYVNRFNSIFVSLDGDEALTDYYRGKGTFRKVMANLNSIRDDGFEGEIVARMTVGEETEIDHQVLGLINSRPPISSVHWQLDALFWQNDYSKRNFADWAINNYNPRIRRLIEVWIGHMRESGEVWRLYPFVGVMRSLLTGEPAQLRCGAGWSVYNIQTDGNITPCPVMAGMRDFYLGNIRDVHSEEFKKSVFVSEPCSSCRVFHICGGRCLYANATKLWGTQGYQQVCDTVINLIQALTEAKFEVKGLLEDGTIRPEGLDYPAYNGAEIIP